MHSDDLVLKHNEDSQLFDHVKRKKGILIKLVAKTCQHMSETKHNARADDFANGSTGERSVLLTKQTMLLGWHFVVSFASFASQNAKRKLGIEV
jgi:hypothetical protein